VLISTRVLDVANDKPIRDALVMILRPELAAADVDMNRLDEQVISWGRSNLDGEVFLRQAVAAPQTYSVVIVAPGYRPLLGESELALTDETPRYFDPWGVVRLRGQ
jgi:hypothetical protein